MHNIRELALNCRVNLECNAEMVSNQTQHKKMDTRQELQKTGARFHELALNYRVYQDCSYKGVKGLATLDCPVGEFFCYLTGYNDKWKKTRVADKPKSG